MLYIIYNYIHVSYLALKKSQKLIINSLVFFTSWMTYFPTRHFVTNVIIIKLKVHFPQTWVTLADLGYHA